MAKARKIASFLGLDLSTTALGFGVRSADGEEDFISVDMKGETEWHEGPAFDLKFLPFLLKQGLTKLQVRGWDFSHPGALSLSVRQHDMVVIGENLRPLIPALSWQCNLATTEVQELQEMGAEKTVGKIEPRLILPKARWVLKQEPDLRGKIFRLMTTGDYISLMLTGLFTLSTSDALSNGLLDQKTKKLAFRVIWDAGLEPTWFPVVVLSGQLIGKVASTGRSAELLPEWEDVVGILKDWQLVAGLGDNHATGVGCGLSDFDTIVISGGSSGTVVRMCFTDSVLRGKALCFEYYRERLLLRMLADCAVWYNRFVEDFGGGRKLDELDSLALQANTAGLRRVLQRWDGEKEKWQEVYPEDWDILTLGEKVASIQASIGIELLLLVKEMLQEVEAATQRIHRFVLTGGLSRSPFLQLVFQVGLPLLAEGSLFFVSAREGPLSSQAATLGAIINAMLGTKVYPDLVSASNDLCPLKSLSVFPHQRDLLWGFLREYLS